MQTLFAHIKRASSTSLLDLCAMCSVASALSIMVGRLVS
jgi:hypothetical protein